MLYEKLKKEIEEIKKTLESGRKTTTIILNTLDKLCLACEHEEANNPVELAGVHGKAKRQHFLTENTELK